MVIGDLSKDDARKFWEEYLPSANPSIPVPTLCFNEVYSILGGHMYHLEHCYFHGVRPELTSIVKMAMVRWSIFLFINHYSQSTTPQRWIFRCILY